MNSREHQGFRISILKTPGILKRAIRGFFTKHILAKRGYKRGDGISRIPIHQISLKIVNACNLRCKTCVQWGETGYNIGKSRHRQGTVLQEGNEKNFPLDKESSKDKVRSSVGKDSIGSPT